MTNEKFENYAEGFVDGGMGVSRLVRQAHDAEISALRSQLEEAKEIIRIFADVEPSTLVEPGGKDDRYTAYLSEPSQSHDFTGNDIRRARSFLQENGNG